MCWWTWFLDFVWGKTWNPCSVGHNKTALPTSCSSRGPRFASYDFTSGQGYRAWIWKSHRGCRFSPWVTRCEIFHHSKFILHFRFCKCIIAWSAMLVEVKSFFSYMVPAAKNTNYGLLQSTKLMDHFMKLAKSNTNKSLETCGILAGSLVRAINLHYASYIFFYCPSNCFLFLASRKTESSMLQHSSFQSKKRHRTR